MVERRLEFRRPFYEPQSFKYLHLELMVDKLILWPVGRFYVGGGFLVGLEIFLF
jgi:hypothetical protein